MRINQNNILVSKAGMSYIQILILVTSTFAFAYIIYFVSPISATEIPGIACCEKTKTGNICQYVKEEDCDVNFKKSPTQCEYTDYCKLGCCFSEKSGWCNENAPKLACNNGIWYDAPKCNIQECERVCCVLGNDAIFTTKRNCESEAAFFGLTPDFRTDVKTELECIFLTEKDEEGACISGEYEKTCRHLTNEECKTKGGSFYKNIFCSDPSLGTDCISKHHTNCIEGKDEVYWFDSCGNSEDVYKHCNLFTGSYCGQYRPDIDTKPEKGDYVCRDLNCKVNIDGKTVIKKNGESWCEYEGTIGSGRDIPGSMHIRHVCFMGEERIEPCESYRNQICVQSDTPIDRIRSKEVFTEAACRINNWRVCLDYNTIQDKEKMQKKCKINPDCFVKGVYVDEYFQYNFCSPQFPPGFDLSSENGGRSAEMVCSMANQRCTITYVKDLGGWDCVANCDCNEAIFTEQMNDLCISLGDCGAYVNIAGDVTDDGYSVTRAQKLSDIYLKTLSKFAHTVPGQKAQPGNWSSLFGDSIGSDFESGGGNYLGGAIAGGALGWAGVAFLGGVSSIGGAVIGTVGGLPFIKDIVTTLKISDPGGLHSTPTASWNALGAGIGAAAGSYLAMELMGGDLPPDAALLTSITSSVLGTYAGMQGVGTSATGTVGFFQTAFAAFVWAFIIAIIIIVILEAFGVGETKEKYATFNCLPWQPPTGGLNCDLCNGNPFKPCSAYRCKSLGQTCELVNKGTKNEMCINIAPNDVSSPKISPLLDVISEGFEYTNIKDIGFEIRSLNGECIPEFSKVIFGIETNKPSQCKIDTGPLKSFKDMEDGYFGGSNLFLMNHTTVLSIPSPEAFKNQYNLTETQVSKLGEFKLYVRCRSAAGAENEASYAIKSCVKPGPDITPPYVAGASPDSGSYIHYNQSQINLSFFVNEPADCKWSISDVDYEQMENSIDCQKDLEDSTFLGWPCNTNLLEADKINKFFIRCQDISDKKNPMTQSYAYEVLKSASPLIIEEFRPVIGYEITTDVEPVSFELELKTSGGAEDGKAVCKWGGNGYSDIFQETNSNYHKYKITSGSRGDYNIKFICEDIAGNIATADTSFKVAVDNSGPAITRVFYSGGLKIITDENAECRYMFNNKLSWENATEMSGNGQVEHTAEWQLKTYYVQCGDIYGNKGKKIVIKPYSLI